MTLGTKGEIEKLHTKGHANCHLAVDTRTGEILASLEYELRYNKSGRIVAVYVHGLGKIIKDTKAANIGNDRMVERTCQEKMALWVSTNWDRWVPAPFKTYHDILMGGGSYWPNKCIGARRWWSKKKKFASYEHRDRDGIF